MLIVFSLFVLGCVVAGWLPFLHSSIRCLDHHWAMIPSGTFTITGHRIPKCILCYFHKPGKWTMHYNTYTLYLNITFNLTLFLPLSRCWNHVHCQNRKHLTNAFCERSFNWSFTSCSPNPWMTTCLCNTICVYIFIWFLFDGNMQ